MRPQDAEAQRQYLATQAEAQPGPAYDDENVLRRWSPAEYFYTAGNRGKHPRHPVPRGAQLFPLAHPEYALPNTEYYQPPCQIRTLRRVGRYNRPFHAQVVPPPLGRKELTKLLSAQLALYADLRGPDSIFDTQYDEGL